MSHRFPLETPQDMLLVNLTLIEKFRYFCKFHWQGLIVFFTPLLLAPLLYQEPILAYRYAYILLVMTVFWILEPIPLFITSLFPIAFFPLAGIMDSSEVCMAYFKDSTWLFFGSLMIALAVEHSGLHKRIALKFMLLLDCSPRSLHLSLVIVTTFISMWISNSAATTMICPIIKAIIEELSEQNLLSLNCLKVRSDGIQRPSKTVLCYYLGVAYASSIGGLGTLIGTGTNIIFKGIYESYFGESENVEFLQFTFFALPIMIMMTIFILIWLQWLYMGLFQPKSIEAKAINDVTKGKIITKGIIKCKLSEIGSISAQEVQVIFVFLIMIGLIITRNPGFFPGWASLIEEKTVQNSAPTIAVCLLLFMLPVNYGFLKFWKIKYNRSITVTQSIIRWENIQTGNPWGLLFLTGASLVLADGIHASGFARIVSKSFFGLTHLPPPIMQFLCIILAISLTGIAANIALCNIILPFILELTAAMGLHPLYLSLPTTMALSLAFQLPVSTAPNAIVATLANIRTIDMIIAGIGPTLFGLATVYLVSNTWAYVIYPDYTALSRIIILNATETNFRNF